VKYDSLIDIFCMRGARAEGNTRDRERMREKERMERKEDRNRE
jgi:hypothetical protein